MHTDFVTCLGWARYVDGGAIISASLDAKIRVIPLFSPRADRTLIGHSKGINSFVILERACRHVHCAAFTSCLVLRSRVCHPPHLPSHPSPPTCVTGVTGVTGVTSHMGSSFSVVSTWVPHSTRTHHEGDGFYLPPRQRG
eukprot:7390448-Prymnesium_polylepis.2